jgi:putative peptidoglycan lipid II flippase
VILTTALGYLCAVPLPGLLGVDLRWGAAGLTASAGVAGWVEFLLLRRTLVRRIGETRLPVGVLARLWSAALGAAAVGVAIDRVVPAAHPVLRAATVLAPFGCAYLLFAHLLGIRDVRNLLRRLGPRR